MIPESKQGGYPWDVWQTALQAEADIRNEVDHPFDIIAQAILKVLVSRPHLGAETMTSPNYVAALVEPVGYLKPSSHWTQHPEYVAASAWNDHPWMQRVFTIPVFGERSVAALQAEVERAKEERKDRERQVRVSEYRRAVEWLHGRAKAMNDPHARAVLDLAGDEYGRYRSRALANPEKGRG